MSWLVDPRGAQVFASPIEQEMAEAEQRMRHQLAMAIYERGSMILGPDGRPAVPWTPPERPGLAAWLKPDAPTWGRPDST